MSVKQITFASRPVDQVTLTCSLSGSMMDIESYMWIIHETDRPIYVYMVSKAMNFLFCFQNGDVCSSSRLPDDKNSSINKS